MIIQSHQQNTFANKHKVFNSHQQKTFKEPGATHLVLGLVRRGLVQGLVRRRLLKGLVQRIGRVLGLVRGILMQGLVQRRLFKGTTIIVYHNYWGNDCVPLKSYSSPPPQLTTIIIIVVIDHAIIMIPQGIMT